MDNDIMTATLLQEIEDQAREDLLSKMNDAHEELIKDIVLKLKFSCPHCKAKSIYREFEHDKEHVVFNRAVCGKCGKRIILAITPNSSCAVFTEEKGIDLLEV